MKSRALLNNGLLGTGWRRTARRWGSVAASVLMILTVTALGSSAAASARPRPVLHVAADRGTIAAKSGRGKRVLVKHAPLTAGTNDQDVISSQVATGGNTVQVDGPRITSVGAAGPMLPCDIYAAAHTPCVAAYSTVRALYGSYDGPLYQVQRASDQAVSNIGLLRPGGTADAAAQEAFCAGTSCTITWATGTRHRPLVSPSVMRRKACTW